MPAYAYVQTYGASVFYGDRTTASSRFLPSAIKVTKGKIMLNRLLPGPVFPGKPKIYQLLLPFLQERLKERSSFLSGGMKWFAYFCSMFANEVRLGNIVLESGKPVMLDAPRLIALLSGNDTSFAPVPLSLAWIAGASYNELENEYMFPELSQWALDLEYKEIVFNGGFIATSAPVAYVHQLQNFFFAMTGQELELPLEHIQQG